jgi:hypothetical protein
VTRVPVVVLVFVIGECVAFGLFHLLKRVMRSEAKGAGYWTAVVKGVLERLTLLVGLLAGFPHILIAFGALKLGTRLTEETENPISNSYFLLGNLLSMLLAMLYAIITRNLWP